MINVSSSLPEFVIQLNIFTINNSISSMKTDGGMALKLNVKSPFVPNKQEGFSKKIKLRDSSSKGGLVQIFQLTPRQDPLSEQIKQRRSSKPVSFFQYSNNSHQKNTVTVDKRDFLRTNGSKRAKTDNLETEENIPYRNFCPHFVEVVNEKNTKVTALQFKNQITSFQAQASPRYKKTAQFEPMTAVQVKSDKMIVTGPRLDKTQVYFKRITPQSLSKQKMKRTTDTKQGSSQSIDLPQKIQLKLSLLNLNTINLSNEVLNLITDLKSKKKETQ